MLECIVTLSMIKYNKAMRIFKIAWFNRYAKKQRITDSQLINAIREAEQNGIDADLGGGVIKQRIARQGSGKSSGYRTIIYYRRGERAFFIYGFGKNERGNINATELKAFKQLAPRYLSLTMAEIDQLLTNKEITEVENDDL